MNKDEIKSKVLAWAIDVIARNELATITDDHWETYASLAAHYLADEYCAMGWNNLFRCKMQEAGCSYLVADMFSWARYELADPGSVDWLRKKANITIGQSNVMAPGDRQAWLIESGAADVLGVRDSFGGEK